MIFPVIVVTVLVLFSVSVAASKAKWVAQLHDRLQLGSVSFANEVSEHFRSNIRHKFTSSNQLSDAFTRHSANVVQNSEQRHSFVFKTSETCNESCHQTLQQAFRSQDSISSYDFLKSNIVVVSTIGSNYAEVLGSRGDSILETIPLLPDLKIDHTITSAIAEASPTLETYSSKSDCKSYYIIVAPQQQAELDQFVLRVRALSKQSNARFAFDSAGLRAGEQSTASITMSPSDVNGVHTCHLSVDESVISSFAQMNEVVWIEFKNKLVLTNRWSKGLCQTGDASNYPLYTETAINGSTEIVGISDTGLDMSSCYFYDPNVATPYDTVNKNHRKVVMYETYADQYESSDAHGSHVCGSIAGYSYFNYGDFKKYNGMAYGAKIAFFDIQVMGKSSLSVPSNIYTDMLLKMYNAGARIMSNSWVVQSDNSYNSLALAIDKFMYDYPDSLIFFSNGNYGLNGAKTVGAPATFKNGIAVGASMNDHESWLAYSAGKASSDLNFDAVAGFSSQGPTADGRMKPDLLAPGAWTTSAYGFANSSKLHCSIYGMQGTSMASPTAAGIATLVREYFTLGYYPSGTKRSQDAFEPSGALIKAMMIHSSQRVYTWVDASGTGSVNSKIDLTAYPSNYQGYGRIQINTILNFHKSSQSPISLFVLGSSDSLNSHYVEIQSSTTHTYTVTTGNTATNSIRVTMVYMDIPPTQGGSGNPMVNILSLSVVGPNAVYNPYISSSTAQVIDIANAGSSKSYTIRVSAGTLSATQPYALVVTGIVDYVNSTSTVSATDTSYLGKLKGLADATISKQMTSAIVALSIIFAVIASVVYMVRREVKEIEHRRAEERADAMVSMQMAQIQLQEALEQQHTRHEHGTATRAGSNGNNYQIVRNSTGTVSI